MRQRSAAQVRSEHHQFEAVRHGCPTYGGHPQFAIHPQATPRGRRRHGDASAPAGSMARHGETRSIERTSNVRDTVHCGRHHHHRSDPAQGRRSGGLQIPGGQQFAAAHHRRQLGAGQLLVRVTSTAGASVWSRASAAHSGRGTRSSSSDMCTPTSTTTAKASDVRRWKCGPPRSGRIWREASRASTGRRPMA